MGPVGQAPSACGHSCQEGLPDTSGASAHPTHNHSSICEGVGGQSSREDLCPASPPRCLSCVLWVPTWESCPYFSSAAGPLSPHPSPCPGVWEASFPLMEGGPGKTLPLAAESLILAEQPAAWEGGLGGPFLCRWTQSRPGEAHPGQAQSSKPPGGLGLGSPRQRQSPPSGPKAPSPGNPPPGLSSKLLAAPCVGRGGGRRVLVMLRGPHTLSPPLLSCLAFGPP